MELSQKIRTNAAISYFFLGPLFLLAKRNPNFSEPFVRSHAAAGTKTVAAYSLGIFLYASYVSEHLSFVIPVVLVNAGRVVTAILFAAFFFALVRGAYRAHSGLPPAGLFDIPGFDFDAEPATEVGHLTETERNLAAVSFVPVFGIAIAARRPNAINRLGSRVSTLFFFLYAFLFSIGADGASMLATLAYAAFFVTVSVSLVSKGEMPFLSALSQIPSFERAYLVVRALFRFAFDAVKAAAGKNDELSFRSAIRKTESADKAFLKVMEESFSDPSSVFSPKLAAVPVLNLLFLPRLFSSSPFRYAVVAGQGVALTAALAALAYFDGYSSPYQLFFLPAIVTLYAYCESEPFSKIPGLYEAYSLFGILTFGLTDRARKVREVAKKEKSVSFKV